MRETKAQTTEPAHPHRVISALLTRPLGCTIQEVFHVYLNKFENAVTNLFLVIFGNN